MFDSNKTIAKVPAGFKAGEYDIVLKDVKAKTASTGTEQVDLVFEITGPRSARRLIWDTWSCTEAFFPYLLGKFAQVTGEALTVKTASPKVLRDKVVSALTDAMKAQGQITLKAYVYAEVYSKANGEEAERLHIKRFIR